MNTFILKNIKTENTLWNDTTSHVKDLTKRNHLLIKNGKIYAYISTEELQAYDNIKIIEGENLLLLPSFREMHCHLDKSKLGTSWSPISKANSIIERFENEPNELNKLPLSLQKRAENLVKLEIDKGVTHFRTHIDVHSNVGLDYLNETRNVINKYNGKASFDVVAFPQHGLLRSKSIPIVEKALNNGANIIGGVDPNSVDNDFQKSLFETFNLAVKYDVDIDIHIHDRNAQFVETLKYLLHLTKESNWQNRVTLSHAFGLNDLGNQTEELFNRMSQNQIQVISSVPLSGEIPPLEQLRKHKVPVSLGCDNIYDSWSPYGDADIKEKLVRYGEIFGIKYHNEITHLLPLITGKSLDLSNNENISGLNLGDDANFVLVEADCIAEFIARPSKIVYNFYQGKQVK
ncbi:amidohydrolase family protein [Staphylococcus pseudoxylosus]|uniref:amidohydrolase family protein n=1 Tax=Staphylococcus pseudoxylosus TaxID=2282419 RepID=UPI002DBE7A7C|nr:amidohydrolase family protein [Staphylococcus pseudoxylosus]MEB7754514.1 amidohydrolase family protein [Staphylococcus pseudoxylosus]